MKVLLAKVLALGGLCAILAGSSNVAVAQGDEHRDMSQGHHMVRRAHNRLQRLHHAYYRNIQNGDRAAARRAHLRAKAIRARIRAHRRAEHQGF